MQKKLSQFPESRGRDLLIKFERKGVEIMGDMVFGSRAESYILFGMADYISELEEQNKYLREKMRDLDAKISIINRLV